MNAHAVTNRSISAGTIARTAVLLLALTNQVLSAGQAGSSHRKCSAGAAGKCQHHDRGFSCGLVEEQLVHAGGSGR